MTEHARQMPLDLRHRPAMGREDFFVAPCNHMAVALIDRWPEWGAPVLILQGAAACGKTHLAAVWQSRSGAKKVNTENLAEQSATNIIAENGKYLVLDPVDPWIGDENAEKTLFHLFNALKEEQGACLMTMRMTPKQADFAIPDLASRLRAAPLASIREPDDSVLAALMIKLFQDRQIMIDESVMKYVLPRMERSFAAVHDLVEKGDKVALSEKKPVTISTMRRILLNTGYTNAFGSNSGPEIYSGN